MVLRVVVGLTGLVRRRGKAKACLDLIEERFEALVRPYDSSVSLTVVQDRYVGKVALRGTIFGCAV